VSEVVASIGWLPEATLTLFARLRIDPSLTL
jgi:hypothetical protein